MMIMHFNTFTVSNYMYSTATQDTRLSVVFVYVTEDLSTLITYILTCRCYWGPVHLDSLEHLNVKCTYIHQDNTITAQERYSIGLSSR